MLTHPKLALLALPLGLFALACGGGSARSAEPTTTASTAPASTAPASSGEDLPTPDIDGAEARTLVADGAFLLDVTPSPRNAESHLEGATNIPLPELEGRMSEVPRDPTVIVYCFGGRGSPRAAQMLREAGYENVRLLGPMARWNE